MSATIRPSDERSSRDVVLHDTRLQRSIELDDSVRCNIQSESGGAVSVAVEVQHSGANLGSSVVNLVNTIIGVGALSIPSAYLKVGIVIGIILTALFAFCGWYAIWMLIKVADRLVADEVKKNKSLSESEIHVDFKWVSKHVDPWSGYVNNFFIFLFTFLVLVAYLIVIGDAFPEVVKKIASDTDADKGWYKTLTTRQLWMGLGWIIALPFNYMKRLDSLRFISYFAFGCMIYLTVLVIVITGIEGPADNLKMVPDSINGFECLSVFAFAYACHISYYTVYNETAPKDRKKNNNKSGIISMTLAAGIYILIGLFGYLTCGEDTDGNVLNSLNKGGHSITVGRIAVALAVLASCPLLFNPCRISLISCLKKFHYFKYQTLREQNITFYVITTVLVLLTLIALPITSVDSVLGFAGCLTAPVASFIIPGYTFWKVFRGERKVQSALAFAFAVLGAVIMVVGFVLQVKSLV